MKTKKNYASHLLVMSFWIGIAALLFVFNTYVIAASTNKIQNPSFETIANNGDPDQWLRGSWGALNAVFSSQNGGTEGQKSAKVEILGYVSGDAKWYFKPVTVTPGTTYTLTHDYRSTTETELLARYTLSSGSYRYSFITTLPPSSNWTETTEYITVPNDAVGMTLFHSIYSVGTLEIDNYSMYLRGDEPNQTATEVTPPPTTSDPVSTTDSGSVNVAGVGNALADSLPPTVSIQSPVSGASVSGTLSISVNATDNKKVAGVTLLVDNNPVLTELTKSPYVFSWSTTGVPNGAHTIAARARDASGNTATSPAVTISVSNTVVMPNLVKNPSLETAGGSGDPANWLRGKWGSNNATFSYPVAGSEGAKAAQISMTSRSTGDAKWYFESVPVTAGKTYVLSHAYKSDVSTELGLLVTTTGGSQRYQFIKTLQPTSSWDTDTAEIVIPSDVTSVSGMNIIYKVGTLTIDDFSLREKSTETTPPPTNIPPTSTPPTTDPTPAPEPAPAPKILQWGATTGWRDSDIDNFEAKVGQNFNLLAVFVHWGNNKEFPVEYAKYAKDKGRTLIIFWEATDYNVGTANQSKFSYDAINRGDFDSYIRSFAAEAKTYGGPVILIPFSEMNGDWFPWGGTVNGNTPAKAVAAYRHVRDVFGTVSNVKFGWAPNSDSVPDTAANAIDKYYPGDAYVDYVGVDGFNFDNPWMTFDQVFGPALRTLSTYNKPIYLFSFASADGPKKADWMRDAFYTQIPKYPLLVGWSWFNENKERDWRIWSDSASFSVFQEVVASYK